jgi:hypothetical protein
MGQEREENRKQNKQIDEKEEDVKCHSEKKTLFISFKFGLRC